MTRRRSTVLAAALATVVAISLIAPASGMAAAATEPTLTLQRNCEVFKDEGADTIDVRLTGFPPFTHFEGGYKPPSADGFGEFDGTTDASGNWHNPWYEGDTEHGPWTIKIVWSGGTLTQSLYVDCTRPEGVVTLFPPEEYPRYGCTPNGVALQGHEGDDTLYGTRHFDLLLGGGGDDSLSGGSLTDCLFGQRGADEISGDFGYDRIFGGRGADELNGGPGGDGIRGGAGNDTIRASKKHDRIFDTAGRNRISCGGGRDAVVTNQKSNVAPNCENVTRR